VVNDYADRGFDGHVQRTANARCPSGAATEKEARYLFVTVALPFLVAMTLTLSTVLLAVVALALVCAYPFAKRYTHLPIARRERGGFFRALMNDNHVGMVLFLGSLASYLL
jgi:4-hydroxybenzoate polyprenyltransferase